MTQPVKLTAGDLAKEVIPRHDLQVQIARETALEYDRSDGDLELLQAREYEKGRQDGMAEILSMIGKRYLAAHWELHYYTTEESA